MGKKAGKGVKKAVEKVKRKAIKSVKPIKKLSEQKRVKPVKSPISTKESPFVSIKKESSSKLDVINKKLDKLLKEHKELLSEEQNVEREEHRVEFLEEKQIEEEKKLEGIGQKEVREISGLEELQNKEIGEITKLENIEEKEMSELKKLEDIETRIKKDVEQHPLAKITIKDFFKGAIGAFIGLVLHYTFIYGLEIAEHLSLARATFLYFLAFIIGGVIMYATGFRKVTEPKLLIFWPLRLVILYLTSLLVSIIVLYIFQPGYGLHLAESYIQTSAVMISAIIGATLSDLVGKE